MTDMGKVKQINWMLIDMVVLKILLPNLSLYPYIGFNQVAVFMLIAEAGLPRFLRIFGRKIVIIFTLSIHFSCESFECDSAVLYFKGHVKIITRS